MEMRSVTLSQEREGVLISWDVMAREYDKFTTVAVVKLKVKFMTNLKQTAVFTHKVYVVLYLPFPLPFSLTARTLPPARL